MAARFTESLEQTLQTRRDRGLLRSLAYDGNQYLSEELLDFSSNDYLGFAQSQELETMVDEAFASIKKTKQTVLGSSGSRLLTGDSLFAQDLEKYLAWFHCGETALLFNSGFDANLSLMACLPPPKSFVLFDELVHNSCREGLRFCRAETSQPFQHNNVADLESCLRQLPLGALVMIVIESVYSMDGHVALLKEILDVADAYGAIVVVDEAHGTGVYGKGGRGLTQSLGLEKRVFARVHTFGKAVGAHGAVVIGSETVRSYLVNYARPLIYSTSLPMHSLVTIKCAYQLMEQVAEEKQRNLSQLIRHFRKYAIEQGITIADSPSPIQAVMISGNANVMRCSLEVQKAGFKVFAIRSPTVHDGAERLRIVLHDFNTMQQITDLVQAIRAALDGILKHHDKKICV